MLTFDVGRWHQYEVELARTLPDDTWEAMSVADQSLALFNHEQPEWEEPMTEELAEELHLTAEGSLDEIGYVQFLRDAHESLDRLDDEDLKIVEWTLQTVSAALESIERLAGLTKRPALRRSS